MLNKRLISGVFEGKEYMGHVTIQQGKYVGSVHQVPEANESAIFFDHSKHDAKDALTIARLVKDGDLVILES